jgi:hypothetical protein
MGEDIQLPPPAPLEQMEEEAPPVTSGGAAPTEECKYTVREERTLRGIVKDRKIAMSNAEKSSHALHLALYRNGTVTNRLLEKQEKLLNALKRIQENTRKIRQAELAKMQRLLVKTAPKQKSSAGSAKKQKKLD